MIMIMILGHSNLHMSEICGKYAAYAPQFRQITHILPPEFPHI